MLTALIHNLSHIMILLFLFHATKQVVCVCLRSLQQSVLTSAQALRDGPFEWDGYTRGFILGIFFWGYLFGQIPLGYMSQQLGSRWCIFPLLVLMSCSNLLIPLAAHRSLYLLYALRILTGFTSVSLALILFARMGSGRGNIAPAWRGSWFDSGVDFACWL